MYTAYRIKLEEVVHVSDNYRLKIREFTNKNNDVTSAWGEEAQPTNQPILL
jgi:hypothetical protein